MQTSANRLPGTVLDPILFSIPKIRTRILCYFVFHYITQISEKLRNSSIQSVEQEV